LHLGIGGLTTEAGVDVRFQLSLNRVGSCRKKTTRLRRPRKQRELIGFKILGKRRASRCDTARPDGIDHFGKTKVIRDGNKSLQTVLGSIVIGRLDAS